MQCLTSNQGNGNGKANTLQHSEVEGFLFNVSTSFTVPISLGTLKPRWASDAVLFLVLSSKLRAKLPGREVKANSCNGEKTETSNLSAHTDKTQSLAKVKLLLRIGVCGISAGDEDCGDKLEDERNHVEANKEKSDEAGFASMKISKVLLVC
ncbi:hypothetical protein HG531_001508 [Fusarium graminearum]|nr:hypothetical protein HG531_001508 [Fusarium graminearum]